MSKSKTHFLNIFHEFFTLCIDVRTYVDCMSIRNHMEIVSNEACKKRGYRTHANKGRGFNQKIILSALNNCTFGQFLSIFTTQNCTSFSKTHPFKLFVRCSYYSRLTFIGAGTVYIRVKLLIFYPQFNKLHGNLIKIID